MSFKSPFETLSRPWLIFNDVFVVTISGRDFHTRTKRFREKWFSGNSTKKTVYTLPSIDFKPAIVFILFHSHFP